MGMSTCVSSAHAGKCSSTAIANSFAAEEVLGQINRLDQTHAVEKGQLGIDHRHSWFQCSFHCITLFLYIKMKTERYIQPGEEDRSKCKAGS